MNIHIIENNGRKFAHIQGEGVLLHTAQEALELLVNCLCQEEAQGCIVHAEQLTPDFFKLSSGLAGEILQKVSNYQTYFGIVGDFGAVSSNSLRDFIRESNRQGRVVFASNPQEAITMFR